MKATMKNESHIEGLLYEHNLALKVTGEGSKNPGTEYISDTISIATDDACVNVIQVHFTYVTATTSKGATNTTFGTLKNIIDGTFKSVMQNGKDVATKLRVDSAVGLNEFFAPDRTTNEDRLVSTKRNEGGFVHLADSLAEKESDRNTFKVDMVITNVRRIEADPEKNTPEKGIVKGYIFDFRKAVLPVEFTIYNNTGGLDYLEGLGASVNEPVFTTVWGEQISETIVKTSITESAFGDPQVHETKSNRKDYVITGASSYPYDWNDESTITAEELKKALADRELYVATLKQNKENWKAKSTANATPAPAASAKPSVFNF